MSFFRNTFLLLFTFLSFQSQSQDQYQDDVKSIDQLTKAYYEIISGPIGEKRDFDRLRNLFHPTATFTYTYWSEEENEAKLMQFDFDGYLEKLDYLDKKGFYEEEISSRTEQFGSVIHVMSSYRFWMEDKTAEGRGVTSYQYFYDGNRYWVMSMFWQMESDQFPIPKILLE